MTDNIDFKQLWVKQQIETPGIKELIGKANEFKRKTRFKLILANVLLLSTCIFIGLIWYYFQPEFVTTKIGIIICIAAMVIFLAFHNELASFLSKSGPERDAKSQLQQLLLLKEKQRFQQTTLLNGYFILLSLGLGLYMYEYVSRMPLLWASFSYGIVILWIGLNVFYFRPQVVKKQNLKLNSIIDGFKKLSEQLAD